MRRRKFYPPSTTPAGPIDDDLACVGCGYNLRGLRQDGRCPECGRATSDSALRPGVGPRRASEAAPEKRDLRLSEPAPPAVKVSNYVFGGALIVLGLLLLLADPKHTGHGRWRSFPGVHRITAVTFILGGAYLVVSKLRRRALTIWPLTT